MRLNYRIVKYCARRRQLTGNPLCVFEDARGLDDAQMRRLRCNSSVKTTFIFPPKNRMPAYEFLPRVTRCNSRDIQR